MFSIFRHEVKYYIKNSKELIQIYGLFSSIILLYFFSHPAGELKNQSLVGGMLWIALTMATSVGSASLFQRDYDSGRAEYYQLAEGGLSGYILAKWIAYYLFITIPLEATLPVIALLVDIPVGALWHYAAGLAAGAMALSLLASLVAVIMTGLEKVGALVGVVMLPLTIPLIIFGVRYLNDFSPTSLSLLLFLCGFSLILLPILCFVGASCIKSAH